MAGQRIKIQPKARHEGKGGSVSVTSDALEFTLDDTAIAQTAGAAIAAAVSTGVRAAGWMKTGKLASGITAQKQPDGSVSIVAPPDRLVRDPALVDKLAEKVAALREPLADPTVAKAIDAVADGIVKVTR